MDLPKKSLKEYEIEVKYIDAHLYEDVIYVMPAMFPGILEIQCDSNRITIYDEWIEKVPAAFDDIDKAYFRKTMLKDNKIYAPMCKGNIVMIFDLQQKQCILKKVGTKDCRYSGICYAAGNFWLSPRDDGPIVKWNENEDVWQEYIDFPQGYIAASTIGIATWEDQVMIFPQMANMILVIDCANETVKEWNREYRGESVLWYGRLENAFLFCLNKTADVIVVKGKNIRVVRIIPPEPFQKLYKRQMSVPYRELRGKLNRRNVPKEPYSGALDDYCRYVLCKRGKEKETVLEEKIGQRIYKKIVTL